MHGIFRLSSRLVAFSSAWKIFESEAVCPDRARHADFILPIEAATGERGGGGNTADTAPFPEFGNSMPWPQAAL